VVLNGTPPIIAIGTELGGVLRHATPNAPNVRVVVVDIDLASQATCQAATARSPSSGTEKVARFSWARGNSNILNGGAQVPGYAIGIDVGEQV